MFSVDVALLDPVIAESRNIFLQRVTTAALDNLPRDYPGCLDLEPSLALLHYIVIRQGEKIVAVLFVPIRDHLRVIVPVAPERMRVQIALVPFGRGGWRRRLGPRQGETEKQQRRQKPDTRHPS